VVGIDGSDRDFQEFHAAFVRARRDLPFVLVTPFVLSNGGHPSPAVYAYTRDVCDAGVADPIRFDTTGLLAIINDLRSRFGSTLPIYLTGFSAGGHLAWSFVLTHGDGLAGAALASANFSERGVGSEARGCSDHRVPVRGFFGSADSRRLVLSDQWDSARTVALNRGCRDVNRVMIAGAGHSPFARDVLEYFAALTLKART
jgi:dienelactone hydrolase